MQDETAMSIRAMPPALDRAIRRAAGDIGISHAAVVKLATWEWLRARGYASDGRAMGWIIEATERETEA